MANTYPPAVQYNNDSYNNPYTRTNPAPSQGYRQEQAVYVPKTKYALDGGIQEIVMMFVVYAFIIAAALSAVFVFVGGMSFILSGGNDEKVKQAVNTIRYAIVGLIVTIMSFFAVSIVGKMFGFDFMNYISYDQIISQITQLIDTGQQKAGNMNPGAGGFQHYR